MVKKIVLELTTIIAIAILLMGLKLLIPNEPTEMTGECISNWESSSSEVIETHVKGLKLVDLNLSTEDELMTISGIGEKTAEKIAKYRKENGFFFDISEIMQVKGIGEGKFANMKDDIIVDLKALNLYLCQ